eukprot:TRINITY_DN13588_c0_g1_i3.p2 TRINITY_DN13588_c0_g1~~TRINITY_DN13588_c0_g1_i3.p2  ORF type:complete len:167 (+),score=38.01 TRINITY_DN13588_c0_g1_i3:379-879(+)
MLCVKQPVLDQLVLSTRHIIVQPALESDTLVAEDAAAEADPLKVSPAELEDVRRYTAIVRDDSVCTSDRGPFCPLVGLLDEPPVAADGAQFGDVHFSLMSVWEQAAVEVHEEDVVNEISVSAMESLFGIADEVSDKSEGEAASIGDTGSASEGGTPLHGGDISSDP